ncbi:uncharacterized protein LOC125178166 [Hyalella azteca]|uniref:Uncharacterized protein LOC125178166 n=1 Tax=Hyalella azteca TaxID=294128 RepID=A0A979FM27_HYAAZ|nr:uncharacterized protein LOC125178166 [Hyalella azteca]
MFVKAFSVAEAKFIFKQSHIVRSSVQPSASPDVDQVPENVAQNEADAAVVPAVPAGGGRVLGRPYTTYRLHYREAALCSNVTASAVQAGSVIRCAAHASSQSSPAFVFCVEETADCILATSNYHAGTWLSSEPSCLLYSSYPLPPLPLPQTQGTMQFKLSTGATTAGDVTSLSAQNLCAADGLQFAVVATAAEQLQVLAQVGAEIKARCSNFCLAWYWLNSTLQWADGSVPNKCQISIASPSATRTCYVQDWSWPGVGTYQCTIIGAIPVICQTYL